MDTLEGFSLIRKLDESGNSGVLRDYYLNFPQEIVAYQFTFRKSDKVNFALHSVSLFFFYFNEVNFYRGVVDRFLSRISVII